MTTNPIGDHLAARTHLLHVRAAAASAQFTVLMGGLDAVASHLPASELAERALSAWREFADTPCTISKYLILGGFLRAVPYLTPQDAVTMFSEQFPEPVLVEYAGHVFNWLPDDGSPAVPGRCRAHRT